MRVYQGNFYALLAAVCLLQSLIHPVAAATWTTEPAMNSTRYAQTATLLTDGRVLVAGGLNSTAGNLTNAEIFNPATGIWTNIASLKTRRSSHTATLLPNGQVLVVGGSYGVATSFLASAELYNPAAGTWTNTGALHTGRELHTATLLPNGQVLVAGGFDGTNQLASAEIYDPATGQWTVTAPMNRGRSYHAASLLADGTVLVAGGYTGSNSLASAEIYNPATSLWTSANPMNYDRRYHTATRLMDGTVLVVGGLGTNTAISARNGEIFNPATGNWTPTSSATNLWEYHTASLLPNGKVLVCGGVSGIRAGLYDPVAGVWTTNTAWLNVSRQLHTATVLPGGRLLVAGGNQGGIQATNSVEIYDYTSGKWTLNSLASTNISIGTLTLLPNGKVLAAGGAVTVGPDSFLATNLAQIYDPATGNWSAINPMNYARAAHTATLLQNGNVLVAGGYLFVTNGGSPVSNPSCSEIFVPSSGQWLIASNLNYPRSGHTATLLPNGQVLIAGGLVTNSELFNPADGSWTTTGSLNRQHFGHTATLLLNGKVLVAGGYGSSSATGFTETYDPVSGLWTTNGSMTTSRASHAATLLTGGKVLVTGGYDTSSVNLSSAELFDPATGKWTNTGSMTYTHRSHKAVLLPNGKVLVAGGYYPLSPPNPNTLWSELYDPASGSWSLDAQLNMQRSGNAGAFLPDGKFLVAGGTNLATAELYDSGIGYPNTAQPQITSITSTANLGSSLVVTGANFCGVSGSSGGNGSQDSTTGYPLVQLRSLQSGATVFLPVASWGTNFFVSQPVAGFPPGYALATVFVNGIPSTSGIVNIGVQAPILFDLHKLSSLSTLTNGAYQFTLDYYAGAAFTVQGTSNISTSPGGWPTLGTMTEVSPGVYQFTDLFHKSSSKMFYTAHFP